MFKLVLADGDVPHTDNSAGSGCDSGAVVGTGSTYNISPVRHALTH